MPWVPIHLGPYPYELNVGDGEGSVTDSTVTIDTSLTGSSVWGSAIEGDALRVRITPLAYSAVGGAGGSIYWPATLAVESLGPSYYEIINEAPPYPAANFPPGPEGVTSWQNDLLADIQGTGYLYLNYHIATFTGDGLPMYEQAQFLVEVWDDDAPSPEPSGCFWTDLVGVSQECGGDGPPTGNSWVLDETFNPLDTYVSPFFYTGARYPWSYMLCWYLDYSDPGTMTMFSTNATGYDGSTVAGPTLATDGWSFSNEVRSICYHWGNGQHYIGGYADNGMGGAQGFVSAWGSAGDFNAGFEVSHTEAPFQTAVVTRMFEGSSGSLILYGNFEEIDSVSQMQFGSVSSNDGSRTNDITSPSAFGGASRDNAIDMHSDGTFVGVQGDTLQLYTAAGVPTTGVSLASLADDEYPFMDGVAICVDGDGYLLAMPATGDDHGVTVIRVLSTGHRDTSYVPLEVPNFTDNISRVGPPELRVDDNGDLLVSTGLFQPIKRYTRNMA